MSGDYTYDDNEGVNLSDTDSGANTASGLEGYDGDISPDGNWPGITPNTKELVAKVDDMRAVVTDLRNLADRIREAAMLVAGGAKQVADNLDLAASAIEAAANGYDNAEHSNRSGFNQ
jgi:hypothetical protein